jgi:HemY protein
MKWFFIFLVQVILLVTVGYLLTIYPGMITVNWIGYQAETSLLVFATIVLIISITFGLLIKILATLINAPFLLKSRYQKRSAEKGIHSVIEAMTAWSAQDSVQTVGKADEIRRFLHERDLANYLEAEAAFMKGDIQTAQRFYQDMLYAHGFQFLACQGMTRIYLKLHNDKQALEWAQKAKTAYSDSFWAHDIIVDLAIKTNNWELALTEINTLIKLNSTINVKRHQSSPTWLTTPNNKGI